MQSYFTPINIHIQGVIVSMGSFTEECLSSMSPIPTINLIDVYNYRCHNECVYAYTRMDTKDLSMRFTAKT